MKINWTKELNPAQLDAVRDTEGPMLVIAGAGSGKTRVLTYRVAYLISEKKIDPESIMAVTFTNKAANEMLERIINLVGRHKYHTWIATFHRTCANILRNYGDRPGFLSRFTVFDESEQIAMVKRAMKKLGFTPKEYSPDHILGRISRAKSSLIDPAAFEENAISNIDDITSRIYKIYQEGLRDQKGYDFDDLIMEAYHLLKSCDDVRLAIQACYKYILIDEFQDINNSQYEFIKLCVNPETKNVFAVGDDDQAIYGFRAADPKFIERYQKDFAPVKIKKLEENYRSTQPILKLANEVIKQKTWGIIKKLFTLIIGGTTPTYFLGESDVDEAYYVAQSIREMINQGHSPNEFAILYRTNAQSRSFEETLGQFGIPFKIIGGQAFYQRMEIKDILGYFRILFNDRDLQSLDRIINTPRRGLGDKSKEEILSVLEKHKMGFFDLIQSTSSSIYEELTISVQKKLEPFRTLMLEMKTQKTNLDPLALLNWILDHTQYEKNLANQDTIEAEARLDNLVELRGAMADYFDNNPGNTIEDYLEQISLSSPQDKYNENDPFCTLMTLHNVKGLEFKHVFLTGLNEKILPHIRSIEEGDIEEERRLFYVGITRAMETLHLSGSRKRRFYGEYQFYSPSRFLESIPDECLDGLEVIHARNLSWMELTSSERRKPSSIKRRSDDDFYGEESSMPSDEHVIQSLHKSKPKKSSEQEQPKPQVPSKYCVGDTITHKTFGQGEIEDITPMGDDNFLTIRFESSGRRVLSENSAPLSTSRNE